MPVPLAHLGSIKTVISVMCAEYPWSMVPVVHAGAVHVPVGAWTGSTLGAWTGSTLGPVVPVLGPVVPVLGPVLLLGPVLPLIHPPPLTGMTQIVRSSPHTTSPCRPVEVC